MNDDPDRKTRRAATFPSQMQGRWIGADEPDFQVVIEGSEVVWKQQPLNYMDKFEERYDGEVVVKILMPYRVDSGDDINLVALPEGVMHAFSDHFAIQLVRPGA